MPLSFRNTSAPAGTKAWRSTRAVNWMPRVANLSEMAVITSGSRTNFRPSNSAAASRVTSSVVGPSPPVTKRISERENISARVSRIATPSDTVLRSSIRNPSGKMWRAIKARCASWTSPSKSSVPVLSTIARIHRQ